MNGCAVRSAISRRAATSSRADSRSPRATKVGARQAIASVSVSTSPSSPPGPAPRSASRGSPRAGSCRAPSRTEPAPSPARCGHRGSSPGRRRCRARSPRARAPHTARSCAIPPSPPARSASTPDGSRPTSTTTSSRGRDRFSPPDGTAPVAAPQRGRRGRLQARRGVAADQADPHERRRHLPSLLRRSGAPGILGLDRDRKTPSRHPCRRRS